jgi:hypothetical protein
MAASILAPLRAGSPHLPQAVQQKLYVRCLLSQGIASARSEGAGHLVTFDLGAQPVPMEINPAGEITGYYFDNDNLIHVTGPLRRSTRQEPT